MMIRRRKLTLPEPLNFFLEVDAVVVVVVIAVIVTLLSILLTIWMTMINSYNAPVMAVTCGTVSFISYQTCDF